MCGSKIWTIAAFLSCAYFTKIALDRIHSFPVDWSHDSLAIATHLVWLVFIAGLITETRCWKERLFFGVVLVNFGLALVMGIWKSAPNSAVHDTRVVSAALWGLAAVLGLILIFLRGDKPEAGEKTESDQL